MEPQPLSVAPQRSIRLRCLEFCLVARDLLEPSDVTNVLQPCMSAVNTASHTYRVQNSASLLYGAQKGTAAPDSGAILKPVFISCAS